MIRSMTGYGYGEAILYERKITVEIKSVNHRYNDINIKLPRILNSFEDKIKSKICSQIKRGKTDVYVHLETFALSDIKVTINDVLANSYFSAISTLKERYNIVNDDEILLPLIANFPDVLIVEKNVSNEDGLKQIEEILEIALDNAMNMIIQMREKEGKSLNDDILLKIENLKLLVLKIEEKAPLVAKNYAAKLKNKLEEVLSDLEYDESRFIQEITIFADKSCIDEEIIRLYSHLNQFIEILTENDSIGKKLDFLIQEINREINTIGSKCNDIEITKLVVDMKSITEKIREQIQNIE